MTFLQPWMLWGLPLLLVPIIIHLVNRLRHRPQPWAAMQFILTASRSSINQAKLRQFLVLLFRVLAVAALIFFLSRPLVGGWLGWALSPAPEVVVLVLDRSASMETRLPGSESTRREHAVSLFTDGLKEFEGATRVVLLDSASRVPQELPNVAALTQESFSGPTDTAADVPGLLLAAYDYLVRTKAGASEVWIASDLQGSNWQPEDDRWSKIVAQFESLPQQVRFRLLAPEAEPMPNTAVTLVEALRRSRGGNAELAVILDLERVGGSTEPLVLRTTLNGSSQEHRIDLSEASLRWRQVIPLADAGQTGWGRFDIAADANLQDNEAFFVFEPEKPVHALVVSGRNRAGSILQLAAADFSGEELASARAVTPQQFERELLDNVSVVLWEGPLPSGVAAQQMTQFTQSGGVVVFFPTAEAAGQQYQGMGWGQIVNAPEDATFQVVEWNAIDGPLARTEEGFELPMQQLEVWRRAAVAGGGTVLARFDDGTAFLTRQTTGQGMMYFCSASPSTDWSTLSDGLVLVPMVQRMHQEGARRLNAAAFVECGGGPMGSSARDWEAVDEEGEKDPRFHAGVYRAEDRLVAVNRPAIEDDPGKLTEAEAQELFGTLSMRLLQDPGAGTDRLQGEGWRFFVFAMLLFLLVEGYLLIPRRESEPAVASFPKGERSGVTEGAV